MILLAAVLSAWIQYAADGTAHARAIVQDACPAASFDAGSVPMTMRAGATSQFPDTVCDAPVPPDTTSIRVDDRALPVPSKTAKTVVVFGDTGCRIKGQTMQACNDPAAWPFPAIATAIASIHPDLVVHVGDYYYRESSCPTPACAGPSGDTSAAWNADWFGPAAPIFANAPLVLVRGNHEDCQRGGDAWFRYLDPRPSTTCSEITQPWAVSLDGLRLVVGDSAVANDTSAEASAIAAYRSAFDAARGLATGALGSTWFVTHRPVYANVTERGAMGDSLAPFDAVIAGHLHAFVALNVAAQPPLVINGEGGDLLDRDAAPLVTLALGELKPRGAPYVSANFGFAVYAKTDAGWSISLRNADASERARCTLVKREIHC